MGSTRQTPPLPARTRNWSASAPASPAPHSASRCRCSIESSRSRRDGSCGCAVRAQPAATVRPAPLQRPVWPPQPPPRPGSGALGSTCHQRSVQVTSAISVSCVFIVAQPLPPRSVAFHRTFDRIRRSNLQAKLVQLMTALKPVAPLLLLGLIPVSLPAQSPAPAPFPCDGRLRLCRLFRASQNRRQIPRRSQRPPCRPAPQGPHRRTAFGVHARRPQHSRIRRRRSFAPPALTPASSPTASCSTCPNSCA